MLRARRLLLPAALLFLCPTPGWSQKPGEIYDPVAKAFTVVSERDLGGSSPASLLPPGTILVGSSDPNISSQGSLVVTGGTTMPMTLTQKGTNIVATVGGGSYAANVLTFNPVNASGTAASGTGTITVNLIQSATAPSGSLNFSVNQTSGETTKNIIAGLYQSNQALVTSAVDNQLRTADPISTATGGLDEGPFVDLSLGGPLPLVLRRSFSSHLESTFGQNAIGYNWTTNFDPYLSISGNLAVVEMEGGGTVSFQLSGGVWSTVFPQRLAYQLVQTSTSYRFLNPENDLIYNFNSSGFLTTIQDRNGNTLTITRGMLGVTQVADGLGRSLTFTYSAASQPILTKVQDQSGRSVSYAHSASFNDLTSVTDANGNTTNYSYTGIYLAKAVRPRGNTPYTQTYVNGAATAQTDSEGNTTTLSYVAGGTPGVTVLTDPLGRSTTFKYGDSTLADLTSEIDAAGNTASYTYDSAARPTSFTDRLGNKSTVTYDPASGYPASSTDAQGNTTSYTYQSQAQSPFTYYNLAKIANPDGTSETFTYDGSGDVLTATDRAGKTTTYTYNSAGQVLTATNPAGGVTTMTYNADGTLATAKDPAGNVTTFSYDTLKRLAKIQNPDSTSASFTRDALDHILSVTDERGNVTKAAYDANNNLQTVTDALSKTETTSYDTDDLPNSTTDRLGNTTTFQVDPLGSVTAVTNAAGEKTTYAYNNLERLESIADPSGKGRTFAYDAEGRLTSFTDALGNTTSIQLDKDARTTETTTPLGENTNFAYDSMSRVTSVTDALLRQTSFTYESRGLPTGITGPGAITTSLAWGNLPLLASVTDPNGNLSPITRDALGRVTAWTDPLGRALSYTYDSRSRIASVKSPIDSAQITYDANSNLTQAQYSDNSTLSYTYDNDNRVTGGTGFSLTYDANGRVIGSNGLSITRDGEGRILSITYAPGKTVTYKYESRGLPASVTDWTGASVALTFDADHRLTAETRSNGVTTSYTYDQDSRIASVIETSGTAPIASIALTRDAIGRVTSSARVIPQEAAPSTAASSSSFDDANQVSGATYDARGRLTNDNNGATYQWSASSRLLSYTRPDGSASAITYDGLGQRISRTSGGTTQTYVIDYATGLPTVAIIESGGSPVAYYVYTGDGLLLFRVDATTGGHGFYSFDDTGSTTFLTNDAGTITDTYGISPYGDVVTAGPGNSTANPFTWQAQDGVMQDPGTKLFYARFRYYDGATGRFLSRDPLFSPAPAEVNPYQYAAGDPVANGDPMGLKVFYRQSYYDYEFPIKPKLGSTPCLLTTIISNFEFNWNRTGGNGTSSTQSSFLSNNTVNIATGVTQPAETPRRTDTDTEFSQFTHLNEPFVPGSLAPEATRAATPPAPPTAASAPALTPEAVLYLSAVSSHSSDDNPLASEWAAFFFGLLSGGVR